MAIVGFSCIFNSLDQYLLNSLILFLYEILAVILNIKSLDVIPKDLFNQKIKNLAIFISSVANPARLSFLNPSPQYRATPIKKISLLPNEFSQIQEELTPTLKLRRHIIEKHHQNAIESMYIN